MKKEPLHSTVKVTHQDLVLDEALEESFPASDPVAVSVSRVAGSADEKLAEAPELARIPKKSTKD
jgi:hypothetical protein